MPIKLDVTGVNYTGAHFRGIPDKIDSRTVHLTVEGDEKAVTDFILDNFGWGGPDDEDDKYTVDQMIDGFNRNNIMQFDGSGGVLEIKDADGKVIYVVDPSMLLDDEPPAIELGAINLAETTVHKHDHVNRMLHKIRDTLPARGDMDG